jgi:hypothetical protein
MMAAGDIVYEELAHVVVVVVVVVAAAAAVVVKMEEAYFDSAAPRSMMSLWSANGQY